MSKNWPNKAEREEFEVAGFIKAYGRLHSARQLEVVSKSEKPDYILKDLYTGQTFGVELTSAYLNDRSVPEEHIPSHDGLVEIPYDPDQLKEYLGRLIDSVRSKISKAKKSYDTSVPLVLSVYVNEYISIYVRERHLEKMVKDNPDVFDRMSPFSEIVFWPLANDSVFSVCPE
ncbi:hypothetical protein KA005_29210 [bacterium]|nr:hypothetical protein [bacterium]